MAEHPIMSDVRAKGCLMGVDLVKDHATKEPLDAAGNRACQKAFAKGLAWITAALVGGGWVLLAAARPGDPDLAGFDPTGQARGEARMWRAYYDGDWPGLVCSTFGVARGQFGFSWVDSARLAWHAGCAAKAFRRETDNGQSEKQLAAFYAVVKRAAPAGFFVPEAARLELRWWRERREEIAPQDYARTMARQTALLYGVAAEDLMPSALERAEAMAYRDALRDGRMMESDWAEIECRLTEAYRLLKEEVDGGRSGPGQGDVGKKADTENPSV